MLDKHAPIEKKRVRCDQLPWITPQIQREISRRNRLFKKHAKNPTKTSWEEFKKQRNKVTSLKRKGLKAFCMEASTNTKHHGEFWNNLRSLLPSKGKKQSKILLIDNERVITDSLSVAETFNNYFCEVARSDGDCKEMVEFVDHPSVKVIAEKTRDNCFNLVPVDVSHIRKILDSLDPRKAVGCDKISQRLLRLSSPVIAEPITRLINYFITNRQWPIIWKSSDVVPVFKGSKGGAVVRAPASHQCGPGSNPGVDAICGLSLLLVLSLAPRGFSPGTPVFPSPQKPTFPNSNSIWNARTRLNEFI